MVKAKYYLDRIYKYRPDIETRATFAKQDGRRSNIDSCVSSPWPSARARTRANEGANLHFEFGMHFF